MRLALVATLALLTVVSGRLVQVQALDSASYADQAQRQRFRQVTLVAQRGDIVDRNGAVLATSEAMRAVFADPAMVVDPVATANKLAPLLGIPASDLLPNLTGTKRFRYLAHAVTPELADRVLKEKLPGIGTREEQVRQYPGGEVAADVVGVLGRDGSTASGLEYAYGKELAGVSGEQTMQVGRTGQEIPVAGGTIREPVPGATVRLTIDRDIQWMAQQAIARQVAATNSLNGSVIVMRPGTGEVLAMASAPTFDANHPTDPSRMGNPAVGDVFEPGSVNKVITFSAGLAERVITPDTPITVPPTLAVAGHTFHDAEAHGTEHLTATGVLAKSSNIGTIEVAQKLGKARLYRYLTAFGFGAKTGVGFPGEETGWLPSPDKWWGTSLPTIAFGQGVSVTALQVASVYSTIANGGVRVTPRLVAGTTAPDGTFTPVPAEPSRRVVSARVAHQVSDMLEAVTSNEGTAPAARIDGYRVAGKTGTAQRSVGGVYQGYTASFVGFAPADKPELVVYVVLQDPKNGHFGGQVAAPVFHDVMSYALAVCHVAPTGTTPPVARLETN